MRISTIAMALVAALISGVLLTAGAEAFTCNTSCIGSYCTTRCY